MSGRAGTPPKPRETQLTVTPDRTDYEVGYAKPPASCRFRPGVSGNPRGRPKGAKNKRPALNEERMKAIILDEAYREVAMRDGDRTVSVPVAQAVIRALGVKAVKGDHRSQRLFAELLGATERANKALADELLETAITYKVEWERELDRRDRLGLTGLPEPLPHPDHVVIDMDRATVSFSGPLTKEDKADLDWMLGRRAEFEIELTELRRELEEDPEHPHRALIDSEIAHNERIIGIIDRGLQKRGGK
ncbi:DUF5681 domain-containing protein [Pikeienuella sp. HZG-20]|uniref:DUF5681 domain-containing protein n=1 Tax=Paludibacillus litoralis TaxID=3133267 RepID=UPI0030EDD582